MLRREYQVEEIRRNSIVRGYLRNVNGAMWQMEEKALIPSLSFPLCLSCLRVCMQEFVRLCVYNSTHRKTALSPRESGTLVLMLDAGITFIWCVSSVSSSLTQTLAKASNT